jgi:uncharacterized Tic20 family protein
MEKDIEERIAKDILANSMLELTNPDFNGIIMHKIRVENRKKSTRNFALYLQIFIPIIFFVFSLLKLINISIIGIASKTGTFIIEIFPGLVQQVSLNIGLFLIIYFLIVAVVILTFRVISGSHYRYSSI